MSIHGGPHTGGQRRWGILVGLCVAFALTGRAIAQFPPPPTPPTNWNWKVPTDPPNGFTRTQYHSFITDPTPPDQPPDYTYDGYSPSVTDSWVGGGAVGNVFGAPPVDPAWGDGVGLAIGQGETITKIMGNLRIPEYAKQYFVEVVWRPAGGDLTAPIGLEVQAPDAAASLVGSDISAPDANGWYVQSWEGRIRPQPDVETFAFHIEQDALIDSVWVGTQCCVLKPFYEYGMDVNHDGDWEDPNEGPTRNYSPGVCGAVATANSFAYLFNHYGLDRLIPDLNLDGVKDQRDLDAVRDRLANGWDGRVGMYGLGQPYSIWNVKLYWCYDHDLRHLVFDGQAHRTPGAGVKWEQKEVIEFDKWPEWTWLWEQLKHCEDIELIISDVNADAQHVITLTGLCWDDADGDGVFDSGEGRLYYLDPSGDPIERSAPVTAGDEGRLEFPGWHSQDAWWIITDAFSESIPEPAALALLALGALALIRRRR